MIRVDVEEYCAACMSFTPDVSRPQKFVGNALGVEINQTDTVIRCEYRKRCNAIKQYLERQLKGEV